MVEVNTKLLPDQLLKVTQAIEKNWAGSEGTLGPWLIDVDVLFYGDRIINLPDLTIPMSLSRNEDLPFGAHE